MEDITYPEDVKQTGIKRTSKLVNEEATRMNTFFDNIMNQAETSEVIVDMEDHPLVLVRENLKKSIALVMSVCTSSIKPIKAICYSFGSIKEIFY